MTKSLSITVIEKFHASHYLAEYDGKCKFLHGHTYKLELSVSRMGEAMVGEDRMVTDFGTLKKIVREEVIELYDHSYISPDRSDDLIEQAVKKAGMKYVILNTPEVCKRSTAEMIVIDMSGRLFPVLTRFGLKIEKLRLWETETAFVELS